MAYNLSSYVHLCGIFLGWLICGGKTHSKSGPHLLVAGHVRYRGRKLCSLACLSLLSLLNSSVLLLRHSFPGVRTHFFEIPMWTKDGYLSRTPAPDWGYWDNPGFDLPVRRQPLFEYWDHGHSNKPYGCTSRSVPPENPD